MSASRIRELGLLLVVLTLLFLTPSSVPAQDTRTTFVYEGGDRILRNIGPGRWSEELFGRPARYFDEVRRTPDYVELYTEAPTAAQVRIYPREVMWRLPTDPAWRQGKPGWWAID